MDNNIIDGMSMDLEAVSIDKLEYSGLKRAVRADSECRSSGKSVRLARGISADSYNGYMRSEKDVNNHFGGLDYDRLPQDPTA